MTATGATTLNPDIVSSGTPSDSTSVLGNTVVNGDNVTVVKDTNNPLSFGGDGDPSNEAANNIAFLKGNRDAQKAGKEEKKTPKKGSAGVEGEGGASKVGQKDAVEKSGKKNRSESLNKSHLRQVAGERAKALFPGAQQKYEESVVELTDLPPGSNTDDFLKTLAEKGFGDIAERHNALMTAKQVWRDELVMLKGGELSTVGPDNKTVTRSFPDPIEGIDRQLRDPSNRHRRTDLENQKSGIRERIHSFEAKIAMADRAIDQLMTQHGPRIEDMYKLAPQANTVFQDSSSGSPNIALPETLCTLVLDKLFSLKNDQKAIFNALIGPLMPKDNAGGPQSDTKNIQTFITNVNNVRTICGNELGNLNAVQALADSKTVIAAIRKVITVVCEILSVYNMNLAMLNNVEKNFPSQRHSPMA
jgi:hypothetical protein